ncbi:cytochrome P450 [Sphingobium phenoxybenzoativorans]|uniref:Cytochrome P450 n=1 Tax=Sphingobium phenoxybenzoativorans TaxID=1592790 RepID=A0A975KBE3_9SPHN|nr:cytochrome P450 [Sphingobium phenoxybenzoativorans]QUT07503.1 cytochrome P450 [Sphingobium phenoxybenzoativorans]
MLNQVAVSAAIPDHVPDRLVIDFDMARCDRPDGDIHRYWKENAQDGRPAIFWTPRHGGHWVVTRLEDLIAIQADSAHFSNAEFVIPRGVVPRLIPLQLDPPEHTPYRRLMMPFFIPRALAEIEAKARAVAIDLIEGVKPQGGCEFVKDFAGTMPIIAFLTMMRLPEDDLEMLRSHAVLASKPHYPGSAEAWEALSSYIRHWIAERRVRPGDDPLSATIHGRVGDAPLSDEDVFSMCLLLLTGGLDTVASMMAFIAHFLATHPDHRRQLRDQPDLIPNAVQELARRFGISNIARIVKQDVAYGGVTFRKDDMVLLPMALGGLDDYATERPLDVDFARASPRHTAWGTGIHACPGRVLSQREIAIFLQEWLTRIPEFTLDPDNPPVFTTSLINSCESLPLRWAV